MGWFEAAVLFLSRPMYSAIGIRDISAGIIAPVYSTAPCYIRRMFFFFFFQFQFYVALV